MRAHRLSWQLGCPGCARSYDKDELCHGGLSSCWRVAGQAGSMRRSIFVARLPQIIGIAQPHPDIEERPRRQGRRRAEALDIGNQRIVRPAGKIGGEKPRYGPLGHADRILADGRPDIVVDLAEARSVVPRQADISRPSVLEGNIGKGGKAAGENPLMQCGP